MKIYIVILDYQKLSKMSNLNKMKTIKEIAREEAEKVYPDMLSGGSPMTEASGYYSLQRSSKIEGYIEARMAMEVKIRENSIVFMDWWRNQDFILSTSGNNHYSSSRKKYSSTEEVYDLFINRKQI